MKTIYKYKLSDKNLTEIKMPKKAIILIAKEQFNDICIWAEVNTDNELESRYFEVFATSQEIPINIGIKRKYIGTAVFYNGTFIFHVYENIKI